MSKRLSYKRLKPNNNKQSIERNIMNNHFDELTKGLFESVTRREALRKFGVGLAGMALTCFGFVNKAAAAKGSGWFSCKSCIALCMQGGYTRGDCRKGCATVC